MTDFSGFKPAVPSDDELKMNRQYWENYAEGAKDFSLTPSPEGCGDYPGYRLKVDALLRPTTTETDVETIVGTNPDGTPVTIKTTETEVDTAAVGWNCGFVDLCNYVFINDDKSPHRVAS